MAKNICKVNLRYVGGSSDKEYNVYMDANPHGDYEVHSTYGRTGSATNSSSRGIFASEAKARDEFNKLVNSKTAKGYKLTGHEPTLATHSTSTEKKMLGVMPQLLNEIDEELAIKLIEDDDYMMQEKWDGRRRLIVKDGDDIKSGNKLGQVISSILNPIKEDIELIPINSITLDGEIMGEYIMLFDVILDDIPAKARYEILKTIFESEEIYESIRLTKTAFSTVDKTIMFNQAKKSNAEGVVFKKKDSLYLAGRPNSGGDQLKFKFTATATCIVKSIHDTKRSIGLSLFEHPFNGNGIDVGNCTVYPNMEIPKTGTLVEVKYLYMIKGGSLYQPVLIGPRDDVNMSECTVKQLKYKREESDDVPEVFDEIDEIPSIISVSSNINGISLDH